MALAGAPAAAEDDLDLLKREVKSLNKQYDLDRRTYKIIGARNPNLGHQVLDAERDIGLLPPSNVVMPEDEDGSMVIGFMDPAAVPGLVQRRELAPRGM